MHIRAPCTRPISPPSACSSVPRGSSSPLPHGPSSARGIRPQGAPRSRHRGLPLRGRTRQPTTTGVTTPRTRDGSRATVHHCCRRRGFHDYQHSSAVSARRDLEQRGRLCDESAAPPRCAAGGRRLPMEVAYRPRVVHGARSADGRLRRHAREGRRNRVHGSRADELQQHVAERVSGHARSAEAHGAEHACACTGHGRRSRATARGIPGHGDQVRGDRNGRAQPAERGPAAARDAPAGCVLRRGVGPRTQLVQGNRGVRALPAARVGRVGQAAGCAAERRWQDGVKVRHETVGAQPHG